MTSPANPRWGTVLTAMLGLVAATAVLVARGAEPPGGLHISDSFEDPQPSWRQGASDGQIVVDVHARSEDGPHSGRACEQVSIRAANATYFYFTYDVGRVPVIDELVPSVWVRADRAGPQLLARVVLPRSPDPHSGRPLTALVTGAGYTQTGVWQHLTIAHLRQELERQVRVLRVQHGPQVDGRGAYIDQIVLNVYGGPGATSVWIDDLALAGAVATPAPPLPTAAATEEGGDGGVQSLPSLDGAFEPGPADPQRFPRVRLAGGVLTVGERPFCPRLIEYRGEPLAELAACGFNGVWLSQPPDRQLLAEAQAAGLWLVAPPPSTGAAEGAQASWPESLEPVLCWNLGAGDGQGGDEWRQPALALRKLDPLHRPLVAEPVAQLRAASRHVDLIVARRQPLGTSLELADYAAWLRGRPQLARPGTPIWAAVQTEPGSVWQQQYAATGGPADPPVQFDQVRMLSLYALTAGARGLRFESARSLVGGSASDRRRAAQLELLNIELATIDAWSAGGSFVTTASASDPRLTAAVIQTERSRLVLPLVVAPHSQVVLGDVETPAVSYVVPGVPEATEAYELTPAGIRSLTHKRVAGGIRITLSEADPWSLVVLTDDPAVVSHLSRRLTKSRVRAVDLLTAIAADELAAVADVHERLKATGHAWPAGAKALAVARGAQVEAETRRTEGDLLAAWLATRRAMRSIRRAARGDWELAVGRAVPSASPPTRRPPGGLGLFPGRPGKAPGGNSRVPPLVPTSPLAMGFAGLAQHWQAAGWLAAQPPLPNRLAGGDFEDLASMTAAGWRHRQARLPEIRSEVELSPQEPHGGRFALHLSVAATASAEAPEQLEAAPLWITSAPVAATAGQWLVIRGWTRGAQPLAGTVDGLLVVDSLGGEALAARISPTAAWQPFELWRVAARTEPVTVSLVMTGIGEAWVDDVSIAVIGNPAAVPVAQQ